MINNGFNEWHLNIFWIFYFEGFYPSLCIDGYWLIGIYTKVQSSFFTINFYSIFFC